ncbi:hypothetical protein TCAL_02654 [Tigriopus californicus]|uniref:Uncharacterized protein n=1 Tax=Tigriopus californicus TaxID=6832 RepID=A0A553PEU9_TIGCA|nr:hypothetical protein TCAL_02654 [Tigriopus californicus]
MIMVQSVMHPHVLILTMLIAIVAAQCVGKIKRGDACRETSECRRNLVCNNWTNGSKLCQPAKCSVSYTEHLAGLQSFEPFVQLLHTRYGRHSEVSPQACPRLILESHSDTMAMVNATKMAWICIWKYSYIAIG